MHPHANSFRHICSCNVRACLLRLKRIETALRMLKQSNISKTQWQGTATDRNTWRRTITCVLWMRQKHSIELTTVPFIKKNIDRGTPLIFVRIIMQWYATQKACVRWGSVVSHNFLITNGVRQGGILSPLFFNVGVDCLSESLCNTQTGCNVGGVMINHFMYADDLVIISPSVKGLQRLLDYVLCMVRNMTYYLIMTKQSVCICLRVIVII